MEGTALGACQSGQRRCARPRDPLHVIRVDPAIQNAERAPRPEIFPLPNAYQPGTIGCLGVGTGVSPQVRGQKIASSMIEQATKPDGSRHRAEGDHQSKIRDGHGQGARPRNSSRWQRGVNVVQRRVLQGYRQR